MNVDSASQGSNDGGRKRAIKKATVDSTAAFLFGGPPVSRTRHQRIMLTSYGFRHPFRVCGLDCLLSLRPARTVSTRSLLRELRSGLPRCQSNRGFPEFEQFYKEAELTYPKATQSMFPVLFMSLRRTFVKSAALTNMS